MNANQLESILLRHSLDSEPIEIAGGFKGHLILSVNGTLIYAKPVTIVKSDPGTGQPRTQSGLSFIVTHSDGTPLTDYYGMMVGLSAPKSIAVRDMTYVDFIKRFGNLFKQNEIDHVFSDNKFLALLDKLDK